MDERICDACRPEAELRAQEERAEAEARRQAERAEEDRLRAEAKKRGRFNRYVIEEYEGIGGSYSAGEIDADGRFVPFGDE